MRMAQKQIRRTQTSKTLSVPSPVGGWNARESLADMKPDEAVSLDNFFCTPYDVVLRNGYSAWVTGITGTVNTLASYSPPSGSVKLFAAAGANIYDVTTKGAVGAAVVTGMTTDKFQYTNFGTPGGNFMYLVNGINSPQLYNGTTWTAITASSTPSITGVDPTTLITVNAFKSRLWFIQANSMKAWYLPTASIGGAAQPFDFSSLFNRGGYLVAMGDWSLDAGYGMDDYAVFLTSEGQCAVYQGTDPASASTWALIGIYDVGNPIGRRCVMKYAGDLTVVCQDGLAPLSKVLMSSRINTVEMLTDKIQHVVSDYISQFGQNFGWECETFPAQNMLLINVPVTAGLSYQLVMNTISGAWSRFMGWNAACLEISSDDLYFGASGMVCLAWDTNADNGTNIDFEAQQSFNYFGTHAQLKKVEMLRPIIQTDGAPAITLGVNVDFDTSAPTGVPTFSAGSVMPGVWDTALWDGAVWGGALQIKRDWQTAYGLGYCVSPHMKGSCRNAQLRWISTDLVLAGGGVL